MANTAKTNTADSGRNTAFLSILLSIVGIIVGYIGRGVGTSGFSAGMSLSKKPSTARRYLSFMQRS